MRALLLLALAALGAAPLRSRYTLASESRVWIDGTSTAGRFTCTAAQVTGTGTVDPGETARVRGEGTVPVGAFDCGQRRMNADLAAALKASAHPQIRFDVLHVEPPVGGSARGTATGVLTIAGVRRTVAVAVSGEARAHGRVRLWGRLPLRMTDFGVTPPSGLLGLVRAHDRIVVRFDLVAIPGNVPTDGR